MIYDAADGGWDYFPGHVFAFYFFPLAVAVEFYFCSVGEQEFVGGGEEVAVFCYVCYLVCVEVVVDKLFGFLGQVCVFYLSVGCCGEAEYEGRKDYGCRYNLLHLLVGFICYLLQR